MARTLRHLCLLLPVLCCSACASMSGAWYYQTGDTEDGDNLFLALVNDSSKKQSIRYLKINTSDDGASLGWACETSNSTGFPLLPGQLLVVALPTSGDFQCAVPTRGQAIPTDGRPLDFRLPSSVPTALPEGWRRACALNAIPEKPKPVEPADILAFQCQSCQAATVTANKTAPVGSNAKFVCESCRTQADKEKKKSEPPPTPALVCTPCRGVTSAPCGPTGDSATAIVSRR
ncbi:MAG: hypothetical protein JNN30_20410 [Rhodanobacteraceae bacterium]|nr:hypothetical protein [Rhodanobacteraceae bacterium]